MYIQFDCQSWPVIDLKMYSSSFLQDRLFLFLKYTKFLTGQSVVVILSHDQFAKIQILKNGIFWVPKKSGRVIVVATIFCFIKARNETVR